LVANLSDREITDPSQTGGTLIWGSALSPSMPAWSVRWHIG
jgi:hypothetical protein